MAHYLVLQASSIIQRLLYLIHTGREYDREVSLYYMRARYYDAGLGRFVSRDPIGMSDDVNLYRYVKNNPLRYTDIFGLAAKAFIVAYDEYRDYKKTVDGLNLLLLDPQSRVSIIYKLVELENRAKTLHYARNKWNTDLPESIEEAQNLGWSTVIANYHQYGVPEGKKNIKYVSQDGYREVVFRHDNGEIDTSIENQGTYNFFYPDVINFYKHNKYDIDPWKEWGSGYGDKNYLNY